MDVCGHAWHDVHQLADTIYAGIPLGVKLLLIQLQPGFQRGQAADDFFFPHFHRPAYGSFARAAIQERGFDQVLSAEK